MAIDDLLTTKYLNYGNNGSTSVTIVQPGINTGFYVTPNISNRDPFTVTFEGTNSLAFNLGSS